MALLATVSALLALLYACSAAVEDTQALLTISNQVEALVVQYNVSADFELLLSVFTHKSPTSYGPYG